ncbi:lysozyme [Erythrobacter donghaensis]|uniref:lysozyme n=1 Tax=Erythrobacter donghaensis TaxID=267135 RepID=UPI000A38FDB0|nr:lysozyme [Erythrobacter donghaensis]
MIFRPASSLLTLLRRLQSLSAATAPESAQSPAAPGEDFVPSGTVSSVFNTAAPTAVGPAGIALIKRFEGCARLRSDGLVEAYPDPASGGEPWTIGWGATGRDGFNGGRIGPATRWTQAQCDDRLAEDLARYAADVAAALGSAPTTQNQFDALVSFHYNTGAIARATLTAKHVAGDHEGAAREFARWNRAAGRVLKGLVNRRAAEAELYQSDR